MRKGLFLLSVNTFEQPDSSANEGALGSLADDIVRVDEEVRGLGVSLGQMEVSEAGCCSDGQHPSTFEK